MDRQIVPYEWTLTYATEKKKQYSQMIERIYFIVIILFFIFPGAAVFFLIFILFLMGSVLKSDSSSSGGGMILKKYKIDMEGITVEDVRSKRNHKYMWNEISSYCPYSVAKPFYGSFLKKYAGDDFILERIGGSQIKLKAAANDSAMVSSNLSKKLKIKNLLNLQSRGSFRMSSERSGAFDLATMEIEKRNFNKPQKFSSSAEEKRFYEEKRHFERNYARSSERSFRDKVIGIYFALVILSLAGYYIYSTMKAVEMGNNADDGELNVSGKTERSEIAGSEYIVSCKTDSDCQFYFFSTIDDRGSMGPMSNLMRVSDGNGCVWAVINKKYESVWKGQYPAPQKCVMNSSIKNRKGCDPARKVCVVK